MSRHSRLFLVLAPGLAFSNIAFALTVNVGGSTVTVACDASNTTQTVCDETSLSKAIAAVNTRGDLTNLIDIDEVTYALTNETNLPIITVPTTIRSDATSPATLLWRIQAVRATADLTLENLPLQSGDITGFGSGEADPQWFSAVDVVNANFTGSNLLLEAGTHSTVAGSGPATDRPYYPRSVYVREGDVTLSDSASTEALYPFDGGLLFADNYNGFDRHDLDVTDSTFTGGEGVSAHSAGTGSIVGSTFTDNNYTGVHFYGEELAVADSTFDGNQGGVWFGTDGGEGTVASVRITDSTFLDNRDSGCCSTNGAVSIQGYGDPITALIEGSTFSGNYYFSFYGGADLSWIGYAGQLDVIDTTFDAFQGGWEAGSTYLRGGRVRFTDVAWDGTGASGAEGYNGDNGGALQADEVDLFCVRCTFTDLISQYDGGAVSIYGGEGTVASFVDSAFENTTSLYGSGGALSAYGSARIEMEGVRIANSDANSEGIIGAGLQAIGYLSGSGGGSIRLSGLGGYRKELGGSYVYGGPSGITFVGHDLTIDGSASPLGGAFYLDGPGNVLDLSDSSFTDTEALAPILALPVEAGLSPIGFGGLVYADPGNTVSIKNSVVNGATALDGGALYSYSEDWYYSGNGFGNGNQCFYPYYGTYYDGPRYGTKWTMDGVAFNDGAAVYGASVAAFGRFDDVTLKGNTITGNITEGRGTIVALNAHRVDASCNTFCDNEVAEGGSGIEIFDDSMHPEFYYWGSYGGESKDVRYEIENNVFQDGTTAVSVEGENTYSGAVYYEVCQDVGSMNLAISGYGGESRGHVQVRNNTFVGNVGGDANVAGWSGDTWLDVRGNVFQDGVAGWYIQEGSMMVEGSYNLYGNTVADVIDDQGFGFEVLDATNQTTPAVFRSYTPGTCGAELYLQPGSPGIDQGDPDPSLHDTWGNDFTAVPPVVNRGDIGAFGGPGACVPDVDCDDFNAILDCDDEVGTTFPDAVEVPYDGIDQDCDGSDECDVDNDGVLADFAACGGTDCHDLDPAIHTGATDIPDDGIDQDCSGFDSSVCDVDGDGHPNEECGGHDCDDAAAGIHPGAEETPYNGIDEDCDGGDLIDVDCDGFAASTVTNCPTGIECTDCNDDDATVFPGASDNPTDDIDQDCDGEEAQLWAQGGCGCATPSPTPVGGGAFGLLAAALAFVRRRGQR